jgi:AhpD family alkylhydroperoxidase
LPTAAFPEAVREMLGEEALARPEGLGAARIWAQRPDLYLPYRAFAAAAREHSLLPARLIELVRLRVAFHNQCRSCMAVRYRAGRDDGVSEDLVCELRDPAEGPNLSESERAALHYADLLATDHTAIDDATYDALREHFSEPEIIDLGVQIAFCVGFGRLVMSWDMVEDLPDRFRERGAEQITPWGTDAVVI